MKLRASCTALAALAAITSMAAMASAGDGDEAGLNILGVSPGMSQTEADRIIAERKWNCEVHDFKFFASRECIVEQPKVKKISIYYNSLMPNHPVFRVRAQGTVSVGEVSAQFGRQPDMSGNVFHIWKLGNGLEAELLEIMESTELLLSSSEFSPGGRPKPVRENPPSQKP